MDIYTNGKKIVVTLNEAGHIAYFAGGWVRDFIMGNPSSDIDIATDASPEKVQELFEKTIPIGLEFGVVMVMIEGHPFEVTTFRKDFEYEDGRKPSRVEMSDPKEDALRRDFTINGMFYDPMKDEYFDYVGGRADIEKKIIRTIGEPRLRFKEDRLRMIRAVRFSSCFGFAMEEETALAIQEMSPELFPSISIERVVQEFKKMAAYPNFNRAIITLHSLGLLQAIFEDLKGVPLKVIEERVSHLPLFPKNAPLILFLMELFPDKSFEEKLEILYFLKGSRLDQKVLFFIHQSEALFKEGSTDIDWVTFLADPHCEVAKGVLSARLNQEARNAFLIQCETQKKQLTAHIERAKNRKPLLGSDELMAAGIPKGPLLGKLLEEGEKMAILQNVKNKKELLEKLKESPLWPD